MLICAGLAAISAGIALRMIPARLEEYPR